MKYTSSLWPLAGFALSTLGGTILHFLYDWTGDSSLVAPFSAINESTWEHMKLLFWPLFLFALIQRLFFKEKENYWCVKLAEILLGLLLIPVLFYTYNGVFGKSPDWINIAIFYISALLVFLFEWWAFKMDWLHCRYPRIAFTVICLMVCCSWYLHSHHRRSHYSKIRSREPPDHKNNHCTTFDYFSHSSGQSCTANLGLIFPV